MTVFWALRTHGDPEGDEGPGLVDRGAERAERENHQGKVPTTAERWVRISAGPGAEGGVGADRRHWSQEQLRTVSETGCDKAVQAE